MNSWNKIGLAHFFFCCFCLFSYFRFLILNNSSVHLLKFKEWIDFYFNSEVFGTYNTEVSLSSVFNK